MQIGGFIKQSFIDYPGKIASVVFVAGCNLRCPFCHNSSLVEISSHDILLDERLIFEYLQHHSLLLDGVVITGGEPLLQKDLPVWIEKIKSIGLSVKLDTNGTCFSALQDLLLNRKVDFVAMDVKHVLSFEKYRQATGILTKKLFENILSSIRLIMEAGIAYEFRTTVVKGLHSQEDLLLMAHDLKHARRWIWQPYQAVNVLCPEKEFSSFSDAELDAILHAAGGISNVQIRK